MPRRSRKTPSLLLHKPSGQGFVKISGQFIYFGRYEAEETRDKYDRFIAEWLTNGRVLPTPVDNLTVVEVCAAYWNHALDYYRKPDGSPTSTLDPIKAALRQVKALYGRSPAVDFGPLALRAVREKWIESGLSRKTINDYVSETKRVFKWAASREIVPITVYQQLQSLDGLRAGRTRAKETLPVLPVPEEHLEAVKPLVSRQVAALIDLQLSTGARPGELLGLRPIDFDTSKAVWTVTLSDHKTAYRGRPRVIFFGPNARAVIRDFMADRPLDAFLFSPKEAEAERHAEALTHRRPGQQPNPTRTLRKVGDTYTTGSYRRAVQRACEKAGIPPWTPHRLRHNAATTIRKQFGLEAAQVVLGHASADVTELYAERDWKKAEEIASGLG